VEKILYYTDLLNYKAVNNRLRKLTHNLRRTYEMNLAMNVGSRPKAFWKYVYSRVKARPTIEELCKPDGTTTSFHPDMVNLFNAYFSSVFTSEDNFVPVPQTDSSPSIILLLHRLY